ncbi:MAG: LysM peptidoglycan-binding domain-containing protein [Myxococcales bacterium]|nr:LysM peptidoglycan-binding domain-containing protein [Myxococcales bacterium]
MSKEQNPPQPPPKKKERAKLSIEEIQDKLSMSYIRHAKAMLDGVVDEKKLESKGLQTPETGAPPVQSPAPAPSTAVVRSPLAKEKPPKGPSLWERVRGATSSLWGKVLSVVQRKKKSEDADVARSKPGIAGDVFEGPKKPRLRAPNQPKPRVTPLNRDGDQKVVPQELFDPDSTMDAVVGKGGWQHHQPNALNSIGRSEAAQSLQFDPDTTRDAVVGRAGAKGSWHHQQRNQFNSLGQVELEGMQLESEATVDVVVGRAGAKGSWHHQQRNQFNSLGQSDVEDVQLEAEATVDVVVGRAGAKGSWHHQQRNQFNSLGQSDVEEVQLESESTVDVVVGRAGAKGSWHHQQRNQFNSLGQANVEDVQLESESTVDVVVGHQGGQANWFHHQRNALNNIGQADLDDVNMDPDQTVHGAVGRAGWRAQSAPNEEYQHVRQQSNTPFADAPLPVMRHAGREPMPAPEWETEDGEPTAAGGRMHIVRQGETLEMIAYSRGVSIQEILKANPQLVARDGSYPAYPPVGSALMVP